MGPAERIVGGSSEIAFHDSQTADKHSRRVPSETVACYQHYTVSAWRSFVRGVKLLALSSLYACIPSSCVAHRNAILLRPVILEGRLRCLCDSASLHHVVWA